MLPSRGLLYSTPEGTWYHVSSRGSTTIVRPLDEGARETRFVLPDDEERLRHFMTDAEVFSIGEIAARLAGALDFPPGGYPHQERDRWREVAELLKEMEPVSQAEKDPTETLIPISRLRRFYESLRLINTSEVHGSIAAYLSQEGIGAQIIDTLFSDSLRHLRATGTSTSPSIRG